MKKLISLLVIVLIISCKGEKKQDSNEIITSQNIIPPRDINDLIVFENILMKPDLEGSLYNKIEFDQNGALFSKDKGSYIKIPFSGLSLNNGFNISFSFMTTDDDGSKPQSLVAFADKFSSASRVPFYVYYPGNRISGVYGKQLLWAEDYIAQNGNSRAYYDSFPLSKDKLYFVSINFDGLKVEIFINSEIYASFGGLNSHEFNMDHIIIGALLPNDQIAYPFAGNIHGLKIFGQPLSETEIVEVFNSQPITGMEY